MIHVLTPFSRTHLKEMLVEMLAPMEVVWHPILHEPVSFGPHLWIMPFQQALPGGFDICYYKLNRCLDAINPTGDDWYTFLCDDSGYPPDFAAQVTSRAKPETDAILVSADRGDGSNIEGTQWPTTPLIASAENAVISKCTLEQLWVRGRALEAHRFRQQVNFGDGVLIEHLAQTAKMEYAPDLFVLFNLMQPGRYQRPKDRVGPKAAAVMEIMKLCPWSK